MGRFSVVSQDVFRSLQTGAGVLLKTFNPESPELVDENIICATTGGVNPTCVAEFKDNGEDIDNVPDGMLELMEITRWATSLGFTALNVTPEIIRMVLGAADVNTESGAIVPRMELKDTDFANVWWVGDLSDGGLAAVCLKNALSTGGLSLQTTDDGKGRLSVTLGGHYSIKDQKTVPMEFYVQESTEE